MKRPSLEDFAFSSASARGMETSFAAREGPFGGVGGAAEGGEGSGGVAGGFSGTPLEAFSGSPEGEGGAGMSAKRLSKRGVSWAGFVVGEAVEDLVISSDAFPPPLKVHLKATVTPGQGSNPSRGNFRWIFPSSLGNHKNTSL